MAACGLGVALRLAMSIAHRLLNIETAIPYEDVFDRWAKERDEWAGAVVACKSARALASEMLKLVNALTSKAVRFYWPLKSDSDRLRKLLQSISSGEKADPRGLALMQAAQASLRSF